MEKIKVTDEIKEMLDLFDKSLYNTFGLELIERTEEKFTYHKNTVDNEKIVFYMYNDSTFLLEFLTELPMSVTPKDGEGIYDFLHRELSNI